MKIQTLVVTLNQTDHSLLERMNIQTDAIIGNQCDRNEIEEFEYNGYQIKWLSLSEKGVGLNRNNVMMRSTGDICVFADDDMIFHDGYGTIVQEMFERNLDADIILFNLDEKNPRRPNNTKVIKINRTNYGKYGAARLAFRREKLHFAGISFNLLFGGGAAYGSGEDSIFIHDCLKRKLKIIAVPYSLAMLNDDRESTWFTGYNDKYFYDKGVMFARMYGKYAIFIALYNSFKHRNKRYKQYGWKNAFRKMKEGIRNFQ